MTPILHGIAPLRSCGTLAPADAARAAADKVDLKLTLPSHPSAQRLLLAAGAAALVGSSQRLGHLSCPTQSC